MRYLDQQLDVALEQAWETLPRQTWWRFALPGAAGPDLRRIGTLQVESAVIFEGVNNALKLLGDQYLARVYRLVGTRASSGSSRRWRAFIRRCRMEALEWIIILLITLSIVLPLVWTARP
jgi:hypothetical protein